MRFGNIANNEAIFKINKKTINNYFNEGKISEIQRDLFLSNNLKWYKTCNHNGLFIEENNRIYFIALTTANKAFKDARSIDLIKKENYIDSYNRIDIINYNDRYNIAKAKWELGFRNKNYMFNDLESKPDIIAQLVGSYKKLDEVKQWVSNLDLETYNISFYLDIKAALDDVTICNIHKKITNDE